MRKAKRILQVFQNLKTYGQEQNTHIQRVGLTRWNDPLLSVTGYGEQDHFVLNDRLLEHHLRFGSCDTVVLNEFNDGSTLQLRRALTADQPDAYTLLQLCHHPLQYDIFNLSWGEEGFELALDYTRHSSWIGKPRRGDYKLANLKLNQPVRVGINGKLDFSLSGRRARTFRSADYIFVYLGEYSRFEWKPDEAIRRGKKVPLAAAKHIDLNAILR